MCGENIQELYTVYFDQIPNIKNCLTAPTNNLGGEGASDRSTPAAKALYRSIFKKYDHLGLDFLSHAAP